MVKLYQVRSFSLMAVILCSLLGTSCGYFSDKPVEDADVYRTDELRAGCAIDIDSLSRILEEDVENQIKCLEDNFNRFTQYVRTRDDRTVSRGELELFIQKFFRNNSESIINGLGILFELNMIFLKDEIDYISRGNIRPLFDLIIKANKEAIIMTDVFGQISEGKGDFWKLREQLRVSIERFSTYTITIITQKSGTFNSLNIREFISNLNERLPGFNIKPESINKFLFVKKLLLGGEAEVINNQEAQVLIEKAPKVLILAFDLIYSEKKHFNNDQYEHLNFYTDALARFNQLLFPLNDDDYLFNINDLYEVAELNIKDDEFDLTKYREIINAAKTHLIGGDTYRYFFADVKTGLSLVRFLLEIVKVQTHYDDFKISTLPYELRKEELSRHFLEFQEMATVLMFNPYLIRQDIKILDFAKAINSYVDIMEFDEKVLESFFIVKTVLLGGDKSIITKQELEELLPKIPEALDLVVDVLNQKIETDDQRNEFLFKNAKRAEALLYPVPEEFEIASIDELLTLGDYFINYNSADDDDRMDIKKFKPSIINLKKRLLSSAGEFFLGADFRVLKELLMGAVKRVYFYNVTYDAHRPLMAENRLVTTFNSNPKIPSYGSFTTQEVRDYTKEFLHITGNYRFFRDGNSGVQYVGPAIKRTKEGLLEIGLIRFVVEKLAKAYGSPTPNNPKELRVSMKDVEGLLYEFREVLEELGFWSPNPDNFARNTVLMGDLFQPQSNGDNHLGVDETTEYGAIVFSAVKMSNDFEKEVASVCRTDFDGEFGIMMDCAKRHFFHIWLTKNKMGQYLPKLKNYIDGATPEEAENFFVNVAGFARDINDDKIPMSSREVVLLIGALINIESTYVRFDANDNNIIDPAELDQAFELYRNSIIELSGLGPSSHKYAKSIFLYMIKYMKIPTTAQLLTFHYNPFAGHGKITAGRLNIGSLLYYLVNE